jgi:electron transfer flavoprotein beta subunit
MAYAVCLNQRKNEDKLFFAERPLFLTLRTEFLDLKMKILVAISNVPDTTTKIAFSDNDTKFNTAGVQFIINPYDEWYALVRALELKEAGKAEKVTIIHVGLADSEATIRKGFALGADDGVRIDAEGPDAYFVAEQIAAYAKTNGYDLVMAGKETINYNGSSVGAMISGFMDLPFVSLATKLDINGNTATIEHDIDGGTQVVDCELPMVMSCAKGMAEQRIPNMKGIMGARTKPLTVVPATNADKLTSIKSYSLSAGRTTCKMIDENNMDELVNLLHTEAKVI